MVSEERAGREAPKVQRGRREPGDNKGGKDIADLQKRMREEQEDTVAT